MTHKQMAVVKKPQASGEPGIEAGHSARQQPPGTAHPAWGHTERPREGEADQAGPEEGISRWLSRLTHLWKKMQSGQDRQPSKRELANAQVREHRRNFTPEQREAFKKYQREYGVARRAAKGVRASSRFRLRRQGKRRVMLSMIGWQLYRAL
jgi:hypothetical protein